MNQTEAARYARWSAGAALAIVVIVAGVYLNGRRRARTAQKGTPPPVPASVEQRSAEFTYSNVVDNRTLFTLHASQATEFKDQNRSLLEDVLLTIYGRTGNRHDTVQAHECDYEPISGEIRCHGTVEIDLHNAKQAVGAASAVGLHLEMRDIAFDRNSGLLTTPSNVKFNFPRGQGDGTGVVYDTKNNLVKLEGHPRIQVQMGDTGHATPLILAGSALEFRQAQGNLRLFGPVHGQQNGLILDAGSLDIDCDSQMHPQRVIADGGPKISDLAAQSSLSIRAERIEGIFSANGAIERIVADGNVRGEQKTEGGRNGFSAQHAEITMSMRNGISEPQELVASGAINVESQQKDATRRLSTEALRIILAPNEGSRGVHAATTETLAPGEVLLNLPGESTRIRGEKLAASFDAMNRPKEFDGTSGVEVNRQVGSEAPQVTSARNFTAKLGSDGSWKTMQEGGGVKFRQGDRVAEADHALILRASNEILLTGSATVGDAMSRTTASQVEINQSTGDLTADGPVVTSYLSEPKNSGPGLVSSTTHISADHLSASNASGHAVYSGHARMWQGQEVIDAGRIELWRDRKQIEARGGVIAEFEEAANKDPRAKPPAVWRVSAPRLDYWSDSGKVELCGGVEAKSARGVISSQIVDIYLSTDAKKQQKLDRVAARGDVRIEQQGRFGKAENGEYLAAQGKFVLSGGQPTLSDSSGNTTTGRELTFFLANDTILVGSRDGSRTVTMHRVEK